MTSQTTLPRSQPVIGAILLALALVAGQVLGASARASAQDTTPAAPATAAPDAAQLEPVPCDRYALPPTLVDGENVSCAVLPVPAVHGQPDGPTYRLHTIRLHATGADPASEPLIYLAGGPGQAGGTQVAGFASVDGTTPAPLAPILERQDVILLDQRGTGASEPALACPNDVTPGLIPTGDEVAGTPAPPPTEYGPEELKGSSETLITCLEDLRAAGIDLTSFNTEQNAQDVAALIGGLESGQADIYGVSYGSFLGETVITRFPDLVRSAVLSSIVVPGEDLLAGQIPIFNQTLLNIFAACESDPDCLAANPDLPGSLQAAYDQLTAEPRTVQTTSQITSEPATVTVDGESLVGLVYQLALISAPTAIPALVTSVAAGSDEVLSQLATLLIPGLGVNNGMLLATGCQDIYGATTTESIDAALATPGLLPAIADGFAWQSTAIVEVCAASGLEPSAVAGQPVESPVPTLLVSGANDPYTPPASAEAILPGLPNGQAVTIETVGHDPIGGAVGCGAEFVATFLATPDAPVDATCAAAYAADYSPDTAGTDATPAA